MVKRLKFCYFDKTLQFNSSSDADYEQIVNYVNVCQINQIWRFVLNHLILLSIEYLAHSKRIIFIKD